MQSHSDRHRSKLRKAMDAMWEKKLNLVTAESLTGGGIGAEIVKMPRVSDSFSGGFAVYNDEMKTALLNVPASVIERFSAVSAQVARYMAIGALKATAGNGQKAPNVSIAVTGYAGSPNGFADESEAGKVYIALATCFGERATQNMDVHVYEHRFPGLRIDVQQQTVQQAVDYLYQYARHDKVVPSNTVAVHRYSPEAAAKVALVR